MKQVAQNSKSGELSVLDVPAPGLCRPFAAAVRTGAAVPIAFESLVATTSATIAVGDRLASGRPEPV
jgi:hypothetical protein